MKKIIKRVLEFFGCIPVEERNDLFRAYSESCHRFDDLYKIYEELSEEYINYLKIQDELEINSLIKFKEDYYSIIDIESRQSINHFFEDGIEKVLTIELKSIENIINKQIKKSEMAKTL